MEIITRNSALARRLTRYFTGEPCIHGHVAYRYTRNGGCSDCVNPKFTAADKRPSFTDLRHEAAARKEVRYSTGRACKRGHLAERYVSTGTCVECLHPPVDRSNLASDKEAQRVLRVAAKTRMIQWGFELNMVDRDTFGAAVLFYSRLIEPALTALDVVMRKTPRGTGFTGYWVIYFRIFPAQQKMFGEMAIALRKQHEDEALRLRTDEQLTAAGL